MRRIVSLTVCFSVVLLAMASIATADVPHQMHYQGHLTDAGGAPLDTLINMTFTIYDDSIGSGVQWTEMQSLVEVTNGLFNVLLGSVNPISDTVFSDAVRWLGIKIGSDAEISPRTRLVTVPYAYRAARVDGGGADGDWMFRITDTADTTLITGGAWGIARYGNTLHGNTDSTHVNLGVACTTGASGQNYKYCTVGGGVSNTATGERATVGGGISNSAGGDDATLGGGWDNTAGGENATVAGGCLNTASGWAATIPGGYMNTASGDNSTVGGGVLNTASGFSSIIAGGENNTADSSYATVGGGANNTASEHHGTVGGGYGNTASALYSTVCGGQENRASDDHSAVSGGFGNSTGGACSAIPGGMFDTLTNAADWSMAFGSHVYVDNAYRVVFFEGNFHGRLGINRDDHDGGISYPVHVGTNTGNGNGAYLTAGGTWTNGSSRTFKENFQPLDPQNLLTNISSIPVQAWQYKDSYERHIGPVSEDFVEAFDVGTTTYGRRDDKYLSPGDVAGVALAGVKELIQENQELKQILEELRHRIAKLEGAKAPRGGE